MDKRQAMVHKTLHRKLTTGNMQTILIRGSTRCSGRVDLLWPTISARYLNNTSIVPATKG
jgi:hypothetical protein